MTRSRNNQTTGRPYPRRCHACREKTVERITERRTVEATYDGKRYTLDIAEYPVNRCSKCGASTLDNDADDATNHALRDKLNLLHPDEIRRNRVALKLTQQELAAKLGCAAESISRWESELVIQSRTYDRLLRAFFHLPSLRIFFVELAELPWLGRSVANDPTEHILALLHESARNTPILELGRSQTETCGRWHHISIVDCMAHTGETRADETFTASHAPDTSKRIGRMNRLFHSAGQVQHFFASTDPQS